nr:hypothetical protein L204_04263 [Cryptococcus depauperatus CBS 7855]
MSSPKLPSFQVDDYDLSSAVEQPSVGFPEESEGGPGNDPSVTHDRTINFPPQRRDSRVLDGPACNTELDASGNYSPLHGSGVGSQLTSAPGANLSVATSRFFPDERLPGASQGERRFYEEPGPTDADSQAPVSQSPQNSSGDSTKR